MLPEVASEGAQQQQQQQQTEAVREKRDLEETKVRTEISEVQEIVAVERKLEPEPQPELESPAPDLHAEEILRILDSAPDLTVAAEEPALPPGAEEEYW